MTSPATTSVSPAFAAWCETFGVPENAFLRLAESADALKDFAVATLLRPSDRGALGPFVRMADLLKRGAKSEAHALVDAALGTEKPCGSNQAYMELISGQVFRIAGALSSDLPPTAIPRLIQALGNDPFNAPTGYDPAEIAIRLLVRSSGVGRSPGFDRLGVAYGLDEGQRRLLQGSLLELTSPRYLVDIEGKRADALTATASLDDEKRFLLYAMPAEVREDIEAGLDVCMNSESLDVHPLGIAMRDEVHAALAREAEDKGRFAHSARSVQGRFCSSPFEYAQVNPDGKVYGCCPAMLNTPFGDMRFMDMDQAWNSPAAQAVRASILDGSFRHCDGARCGFLQDGVLPTINSLGPEHRSIVEEKRTRLSTGPKIVNMAYDRTCNLACPSCRPGTIALKGRAYRDAARIHNNLLSDGLVTAERVIVTGSGDPFASRLFLDFLRNFRPESNPGLRIHLSTNAVLLTPSMWESIAHEAVDVVDVSVDAATPETYALNRGGDFAQLLENLAFLGERLKAGALHAFNLHFVVQDNNFHEMYDFVALGRRVGASRICFKELQDWGTYARGEFARRAVHLPEHPRHEVFLETLREPRLCAPDILLFDMGDLLSIQAQG